jgi:hypothetical protein
MNDQFEDRELLRRIAALPREIRPRLDPWPAIAARLDEPLSGSQAGRGGRRWMMQAAAASVLLALVAGLLLGPRLADRPAPGSGNGNVIGLGMDSARADREVPRLPANLAASEAEYQAAFREFITVGQARSNLSQQTIAQIETGWADLRAAENALEAALAANPDDRFLNNRMFELRARQLGFLQELAYLDQSNRRLTI